MPRSPALSPLLLLLLLPPLAAGLRLHGAGGRRPECGPCRPELCPAPARCPAPAIAARDECGCCALCLGATGAAPEGTGLCVCAQRGTVCGSDGRSYPSVCALHLRARHMPHAHLSHLHKARDGPCEFAPVIVIPPRSAHNVTGAQVYLSCEVRAVPAPVITWRKVTQSPEGTQVLEELPGDHVNVAVQVRGGPSDHEATSWVLIKPLRKEDEGVYQCHAANTVGETQSQGTVTVTQYSKYLQQPPFPPPSS
ncbi:PREDICTED: insulin-like growth factor-binding protein-like 1 [Elephantulus edwardii]|uniref:insulin-like growth factor-binding protein-like 1 n=1 Tax=Elephantulus edwardii TaxID=28737 RepID=UPI0003F092A7|nr:PREDICTED: insulin-like growth factor-binding protein-like 1 [Elephantulus edwardii]